MQRLMTLSQKMLREQSKIWRHTCPPTMTKFTVDGLLQPQSAA